MNGNGKLTETENVIFYVSYGILTDERNSYVLLKRSTDEQKRSAGNQNKYRQNCYEVIFRDWSTQLFQQSPLYDFMLTGISKTRSVISLLVEVPS